MGKKSNKMFNEVLSLLKTVAISVITVYLMASFVIRPIRVEGSSMYPTIHTDDIGFTSVISRNFSSVNRFDIVVVYLPSTNKYIIKRVIGLPGEIVEYRNDKLYINGEYIKEEFLDTDYVNDYLGNNRRFTNDIGPFTIKEGEYFVLGDNRPKSQDSRHYGPFEGSQIVGKHMVILFPFNHINVK